MTRAPGRGRVPRLFLWAASVAGLVIAAATSGCGHVDTHAAMLRPKGSPRAARSVQIYLASQEVPRPYLELALVQAIGFDADGDVEDVVDALRARAGALGCDAVVRTFVDRGYTKAQAAGVCVRFTGPPDPARASAVTRDTPLVPVAPPPPGGVPTPPLRPTPRPEAPPGAGPGWGND